MSLKNILVSQFGILHFLKLATVEIIYCVTTFYGYAIFSMLFFGEGETSFMYSKTNSLIYLGLITIPPTIFNLNKFFKHYKVGFFSKSKSYFVLQVLLTIAFTWFLFETGIWFY